MDTENDKRATIEAKKDGLDKSHFDDDGCIYDDYYIRNKDKSLETYEISPKADIYVCPYMLGKDGSGLDLEKISYEKLKALDVGNHHVLFYIDLENKAVVKMQQQYIP